MEQFDIINHINKREHEKRIHVLFWEYIEKLNNDVGLTESTYRELRAKISSKIAQCEISIRDHEKLL
jgi:hypothetical protein